MNIQPFTTFQWNGGDPNTENNVTYEIYLGETDDLEFIGSIGPYPASQTLLTFAPPQLQENKCYYWKVIAIDN